MRDLYNLFEKPKDPLAFNSLRISIAAPEKSTTTFSAVIVNAVSACSVRLVTVTCTGPAAAIIALSCESCVPSKVIFGSGCCNKVGRIARFAVAVS